MKGNNCLSCQLWTLYHIKENVMQHIYQFARGVLHSKINDDDGLCGFFNLNQNYARKLGNPFNSVFKLYLLEFDLYIYIHNIINIFVIFFVVAYPTAIITLFYLRFCIDYLYVHCMQHSLFSRKLFPKCHWLKSKQINL